MRIITITLNPAFDVHCTAKGLALYHENFVKTGSVDAGGKGINLSRALLANKIPNEAVVVLGKENAAPFQAALEADGLQILPILTQGRIRENITIHEESLPETRISFDGFSCGPELLQKVCARIGAVDENTFIAFTGSAPSGMDADSILAFLKTFQDRGAKIIIDSRTIPFSKLVAFRPWLIKPNQDEAALVSGHSIDSLEDAVATARVLHRAGIENVLLTLGGDGAVLACREGVFHAKVPAVEVKSTIGAGDSTIAGFLDGTRNRLAIREVLKKAVAYGTAACLQPGTQPPHSGDIQAIMQTVTISSLSESMQ